MTDRHPNEPGSADFQDTARRSREAGIADESAAFVGAASNEAGGTENETKAPEGRSSEEPAEGSEAAAPRLPGSPD